MNHVIYYNEAILPKMQNNSHKTSFVFMIIKTDAP